MPTEKRKFLGTVNVRANIDGEEKVVGTADITQTDHGETADVRITDPKAAEILFGTGFSIDHVSIEKNEETP